MKKIVFALAAVSALAVTAPAAAQYSDRYSSNNNADFSSRFDYRVDQMQDRLDSGIQSGAIDRYEARDLRRQMTELTRLEARYSQGGLSNTERQDLQMRMRTLRQSLRTADNRSDGWYDRDDRYGSWDNDRWDNNDGRYNGRGGPYEDADYACETRSSRSGGIGGLINSVLGNDRCLSVGQRASSNLYAVPYEYRNQYRDGSGYYYRSDGRAIYRIDTRTNTVAGVYPMNR